MSPLSLLQPGHHPRGVLGQLRMTFRHRDNFNGDFSLWVVCSGEAFCLCNKLGFLISLVEKTTGTHGDGRKCTCWGGSLASCLAHSRPSSSIPPMLSFPALLACCTHWCLDGDLNLELVVMWEPTPYGLPFLLFSPHPCWRTHFFFYKKNIFDFVIQTEFPPCHRILLLLLEIPYGGENVPTEVKTFFLE